MTDKIKIVVVAMVDSTLDEVHSKLGSFKDVLSPIRFKAEVRIMEPLPDVEKAYEP